jgi:hypothetical protein
MSKTMSIQHITPNHAVNILLTARANVRDNGSQKDAYARQQLLNAAVYVARQEEVGSSYE